MTNNKKVTKSKDGNTSANDEAADVNCSVCEHAINDSKEASVECAKCKEWAHVKCAMEDEIFNMLLKINKAKGAAKLVSSGIVTYLCECCLKILQPTTKLDIKSSSTQANLPQTSSPASIECTKIINNEIAESRTTEVEQQQPKPFCYYYKQGRCRHGKTGKKVVNGQVCSYLHPQKCLKYCRFGRDKGKGCDGSCGFFHPTVCRNSLRHRKCLLPDCTFVHLQGTERHERNFPNQYFEHKPDLYHDVRYHQNSNKQGYKSYINRGYPSFSTERRELPTTRPRDDFKYQSEDFPPLSSSTNTKLAEMSDSIIQVQKSIEYLMQLVPRHDAQSFPQSDAPLNSSNHRLLSQFPRSGAKN